MPTPPKLTRRLAATGAACIGLMLVSGIVTHRVDAQPHLHALGNAHFVIPANYVYASVPDDKASNGRSNVVIRVLLPGFRPRQPGNDSSFRSLNFGDTMTVAVETALWRRQTNPPEGALSFPVSEKPFLERSSSCTDEDNFDNVIQGGMCQFMHRITIQGQAIDVTAMAATGHRAELPEAAAKIDALLQSWSR
jgi:hypothetical protein